MADLSWRWIAVMVALPPLLALAAAWPLWRRGHAIFGNLAGTAVIFVAGIAMIFREYVQIDRATRACLEAGVTCWPEPSAFARYAIYAGIAMAEVFVLFAYSLRIERQVRDRGYAPEWR
jgi:hypothetical protein